MIRPAIEDRRCALGMLIGAPTILLTAALSAEDRTKGAEASPKELEALWSDLYRDDPAATNAAIRLYKHADAAVAFLKQKLQPLTLEEDECRRLLEDLGTDEEGVWKAAWETLDYLDPRLAMELSTLMDEVVEVPARTRLVELCSERKPDSLAGKEVTIRPVGDDGYNFFDGRGSWWAEHRVGRIGDSPWSRKMAWTRAARCIAVLEQIGNAEAIELLERLSDGHPDAAPTRAAKDSLDRLKRE